MLTHLKLNACGQKNIMLLCLLLGTVLLASGCATLNKQECQRGDWASIGYNDAIAGLRSHNELQEHHEACAEHQIRPNNRIYFSGYQRGLKTFCTHASGVEYGADRSEYYGTCPVSLEKRFINGYLSGLELAIVDLRDDANDLRHERRKKSRRLKTLQQQTGKKDRAKAIKKLRESLNDLDSQISSRRDDRRRLRRWQGVWAARLN